MSYSHVRKHKINISCAQFFIFDPVICMRYKSHTYTNNIQDRGKLSW